MPYFAEAYSPLSAVGADPAAWPKPYASVAVGGGRAWCLSFQEGPWAEDPTARRRGRHLVEAALDGCVDLPLAPATVRMRRRCEVPLQLLSADGTPFEATTVLATNLSAPEVAQAREQGDGSFLASLSPDPWLAVDEARRASAVVEVPAPWAGWGSVVVMAEVPGRQPHPGPADPPGFQWPSPLR